MIQCDRCLEDFDPDQEPGGLLFTVPLERVNRLFPTAEKIHLCKLCTRIIRKEIIDYSNEQESSS